jgi:hypothetical protein
MMPSEISLMRATAVKNALPGSSAPGMPTMAAV